MYNNHPDYIFHLVRSIVDRALPDVLFTHKTPMSDAKMDSKTLVEEWNQGDTFTLGRYYAPFHLLWNMPKTPLRLPAGVDYDSIMVNGKGVDISQFNFGNNLLIPMNHPAIPEDPYPFLDPQNNTARQNWPVKDKFQVDYRPEIPKVVSGMKSEVFRGIAYESDEHPIKVFSDPAETAFPLGVFSESGLKVLVEETRQGVDRITLKSQPNWPKPLYVRYKIIPQRIVTFRVSSRNPGFDSDGKVAPRLKPSLMEYTEGNEFAVYSQFFANRIDFDCWAIEPEEAMRLAEEFRITLLHYAGYLKQMGISELVWEKTMNIDSYYVRPNRDAKTSENYWSCYRASFFLRSDEVSLVPAKGLYDIRTNARVVLEP